MDSDLVRTHHHPFPLQNLLSQPWGHGDAKFAMYITLHYVTLRYIAYHTHMQSIIMCLSILILFHFFRGLCCGETENPQPLRLRPVAFFS